MDQKTPFLQTSKLIGLTFLLFLLIGGYVAVVSNQTINNNPALVVVMTETAQALARAITPTPTSTETETLVPTATRTATPTLEPSHTPTSTATPSPTATATGTATATATPTPTKTPTPKPTATPTDSPTSTPPASVTPTATKRATLRATASATRTKPAQTATPSQPPITTTVVASNNLPPSLPLSPTVERVEFERDVTATITATLAISGTATPSGPTGTPTPTPIPRTIRANNAPDYTQADNHFWFGRPYADDYLTWGSAYYPYGINNAGQYLWHHGIDIQNPQNTPILAVGEGTIVFADLDTRRAVGPQTDFYGQAIIIEHDQEWTNNNGSSLPIYTLYGHVAELLVTEGDRVEAGQTIALTGQEGVALGPHLHLEIRLGNDETDYFSTQNPDLWVKPDPGHGVVAGRVIDKNGFYVPQQLITIHRGQAPNRFWRQTWTYPDSRFRFDPDLGETFTFGDVPAGNYVLKTSFDGQNYAIPISITNQKITFILIDGRLPPPATPTALPTPIPPPTATPTATPTGDTGDTDNTGDNTTTNETPQPEATPTPSP